MEFKRARHDELMAAAVASGNVSVSSSAAGEPELLELSSSAKQALEQQAAALREIEVKHRQRTITVPAKDEEVKLALRSLGEPICLFGERPLDRRERLRRTIAQKQVDAEIFGTTTGPEFLNVPSSTSANVAQQEERRTKSFFTEASPDLINARKIISNSSWRQAKERLIKEWMTPVVASLNGEARKAPSLEMVAGLNELRPVASCSFSSEDNFIATGSWDESCRIYRTSGDYNIVYTLRGHSHRICHAEFRPTSHAEDVTLPPLLASGSAEGEVRIWNRGETTSVLNGHIQRIGRLAWDPSGRFLQTTSFDRTWRLWDVETSSCLLTQDGHAREVYACGFHPDGALVCTADMGAACLVWDLRAGKTTHAFAGHVLGILAASFSPNGYYLGTGGLDNQVRIWDLRKKECHTVLPAHARPVTACKFTEHDGGSRLVTGSHDKSIRIWSTQDWKKLGALVTHEGPVLGLDVGRRSGRIVTGGYDRAIKFIGMS